MHHCHPCFGGHKPTGPICTTAPVIHPTKQCVTHSFSTTVVHTFSQHIQHMYIINKLKPKLLPANKFKCKCCGPNRPRIRRRMWTVWPWSSWTSWTSRITIWSRTKCISVWTKRITIRTEYWTKRITIRSKYRTKRWWNV